MIRFFYRAGSDSTSEKLIACIKEDLAAGHKAILLVPEQETVSVERRMLELLPPATQLSFEVLNFSRLANRTFRVLGGLSHHAASPAAAALFMWQALGETAPLLRQYGSAAAKDNALCDLMLATAAQCKAACISPEDLLQAAEALPEGEPLQDKLSDIGLILSTYALRLGERFDDTSNDPERLAELLRHEGKALFADTHVYVDSFADFTMQELAVLRELMAIAPTVTVTFPLEDHRAESGLHLTAALRTHKKLFAMAKELGQSVYFDGEASQRPKNALSYFAQNLFNMDAEKAPLAMADSDQISLCVCATPFEEASAIATRIHSLIRAGYHYRDIAVVVRDATVWNGILDDAFEREGIPCFISEKTDITLHPLIKLITGALRIRLRNWRTEDVIGYLKTDLCGIAPDDVNLFEEYVNVWNPKGEKAFTTTPFTKNPDGYKASISPRGARILERANHVRATMIAPLEKLFAAMDAATTTTELCRAVYDFLNILDIREKLKAQASARIAAGERREAEELSRLYGVTVDALEILSEAMGEKKMSVAEFSDALKLIFARTDIGTIPTSADEVTIGSASMLRADHPRFVMIAGLNDGIFPATVSDHGLIGEGDRRRLTELGVEFPANNEKMVSDELFYLYRAVSAPREGLGLYYSRTSTDGRALSPSIAINRVKALFPTLKVQDFSLVPPAERIYTVSGALELYTELTAAQKAALPSTAPDTFTPHWGEKTVERNAYVSTKTAARLFERGKFNPTHLESFAACQFKYYCSKILRLREEANGAMSSADTGTFIHHVLEHVMDTVTREKRPFGDYDSALQKRLVGEICQHYKQELSEAGGEFTPRTDALFARLSRLAELIVSGLFAEFADSLFTPAFLELSLSDIGETPAVTLPDGESLPLTGQIDRVDYWQSPDGQVYLRVADYKTGSKSFRLEDIEKGFCLQMPLYLLALCRGKHNALCRRLGLPENTPFLPAGVTYLSSNISVERTECKKDEAKAMADAVKRLSREGLLLSEPNVQHAMSLSGDKEILGGGRSKSKTALSAEDFESLFGSLEASIGRIATKMRSGCATVSPNFHGGTSPCDYCAFLAVCRAAKKSKE